LPRRRWDMVLGGSQIIVNKYFKETHPCTIKPELS
jgi:hypothetical protein